MKNAKRFFAIALVFAMCFTFALPMAAADNSTDRADKLNLLGLFKGTDAGYQLDQPSTRIQGIVMLIRLLGKENDALNETRTAPFNDVGWGKEYTSYAYNTGLTKGTGATTFTPNKQIKAIEYVTFLLRALGYSEEKGDFTWGTQLSLANKLGMVNQLAVQHMSNMDLDRGDMVDLSYAALTCAMKTGGKTLAEKLVSEGVFTRSQGVSAGVIGNGVWTYNYEVPKGPAIVHTKPKFGSLDVDLLTIDPTGVKIKAAMVNNTLGATASFKNIVNASGADAVVNANFFEAYESFKIPIGHVMVDGNFLYASSGLSSLGITKDGQLSIGRPAVFVSINDMSGNWLWDAFEVNSPHQGEYLSTLYTPAFGKSITVKAPGGVLTVRNGAISGYEYKAKGSTIAIPSDGYIVCMGDGVISTDYFRKPVIGTKVQLKPYLFKADAEGFVLDKNVESIISGAPRLVQDGYIVTELEDGFKEARFTTSSTPRTAIGINREGKLLIASVKSATIQQMRELMLNLGCVDAFNLDGGASTAMYHNGNYIRTPGRELTTTLQIFEK